MLHSHDENEPSRQIGVMAHGLRDVGSGEAVCFLVVSRPSWTCLPSFGYATST
jgi:hypothetical protein